MMCEPLSCWESTYPHGEGVTHTCEGAKTGDSCTMGCMDGWTYASAVSPLVGCNSNRRIVSFPPDVSVANA
jgi:hypothetical protein